MTRAIYSSHPIANYRVGRFQFENTVLDFNAPKYDADDESEFKDILAKMPPIEQNRVKLLDVGLAEEQVRRVLASKALVTQTTDSSHGRDPRDVGTGSVEEELSRQDQGLDANGNPLDPAIAESALTHETSLSGKPIVHGADIVGTGDSTSGENHGAGNLTGTGEAQTNEELAKLAAGQGTASQADIKAAADLLAEQQGKTESDKKQEETSAPAKKTTLGGLNLGQKSQ